MSFPISIGELATDSRILHYALKHNAKVQVS
jgi:hypothetical protein